MSFNIGFGREEIQAVIDVAPGGASAAYIASSKRGPARILSTGVSALSLEARTPEQAKAQIGGQVKEAAEQARKKYLEAGASSPIKEVYVFIHAPWAESHLLRTMTTFEKETRIKDAHIAALAKEALVGEAGIDKTRLLEASVFGISLNGYPSADPEGAFATTVEALSLVSQCDPEVRGAIESAVHESFPDARIAWRSAFRALATLARRSHTGEHVLIIDMGADDTHVASVQGHDIVQLVVPEGERTILARIAGGRAPEETLGLLRMLDRDSCSSDACEALRTALASSEPELVRVFGESMATIAATHRVANTLLLSAHPDLENWLGGFFSRIDFAQFTVTSLPLTVCTPASLDIERWVEDAHTSDPLSIGAALVNIEQHS